MLQQYLEYALHSLRCLAHSNVSNAREELEEENKTKSVCTLYDGEIPQELDDLIRCYNPNAGTSSASKVEHIKNDQIGQNEECNSCRDW